MMIPVEQAIFLLILAAALVLFIRGRPRIDVTAMVMLLTLVLTSILTPEEALSGFTSEPALIVASVFVMSAGLGATGVTDRIGHWIGAASGAREWRAILVIMPAVALLAAFSHHLMVTAMMLPIVMRFAKQNNVPASRLLMPMSLAASLGTTLTVFSAPAFLLASDMLVRQGADGLEVFEILPIGLVLVTVGVLYITVMRWILPRRNGVSTEQDYLRLEQYYTELLVEQGSAWVGKPLSEFTARFHDRFQFVDRIRGESRVASADVELEAGDVLLVRASPDELTSIKGEPGLALNPLAKYESRVSAAAGNSELVQVIVGPQSEFAGRSIGDIDFYRTLGVLVVGLWRRDSFMLEKLSEVTLNEGDLLVLSGNTEQFTELAQHRGFLMMVPFASKQKLRHRAPLAIAIMLGVVALASSGVLAIEIVFLLGAVAMVLTGCVSVEKAYHEIDVRIFVMIAGVIPLGIAMEKTGTARLFADQLLTVSGGWNELAILAVMFGAAALLTQVLSDAATAVLIGPVAIAVAQALGLDPTPFVVCAALGAVASFLTPIGHHGNLMILAPGRYTFWDFLRVGLPLTVLLCAASAWTSRALWLNGPWLPWTAL